MRKRDHYTAPRHGTHLRAHAVALGEDGRQVSLQRAHLRLKLGNGGGNPRRVVVDVIELHVRKQTKQFVQYRLEQLVQLPPLFRINEET